MAEAKTYIGTNTIAYPQLRNFVSLPFKKYAFKKYLNYYKFLDYIYFKTFKKSKYLYQNSFLDLDLPPVKLYHFFNTISYGKKPWITTFETDLPRWYPTTKSREEKGMKLLAGSSCKALIALSENTLLHKRITLANYPHLQKELEEKMFVLHPPQRMLISDYHEKILPTDTLVFSLVGADFFRKGGRELVQAFDVLLGKKYPLKLNIISKLDFGDYATQTTRSDQEDTLRIIGKYPASIKHFPYLENSKVLELFKNSHVALLPSWADTYGYSLLEGQANGCPVISTNIRALPEINKEASGWIARVPVDEAGDSIVNTQQDRDMFSSILKEQLIEILEGIVRDPGSIARKGMASMERIKMFHNPQHNVSVLENLYDRCHST